MDVEDKEEISLDRLADEITTLAAHISAATCQWLLLLAEFDRRDGWWNTGAKSCAHWVAWMCSMSAGAAREHVRVARRLEELPLIREAFARGELSYSKVRALTRVQNVHDEEQLLNYGRAASASQLDRIVSAYRGVVASDAERSYDRRCLWVEPQDDGSVLIKGRVPAEDGALLMKALDAAHEELRASAKAPAAGNEGVPAGTEAGLPEEARVPQDFITGNVEALVLLADSFLASGPRERSGGDRCQVVVHIDAETLCTTAAEGSCETDEGVGLAVESGRRLACDASIVSMIHRNGKPLSVGRKTRSIPPALRRALRRRDDGCQFPGCHQRRCVDAHHIEHWAHGGKTEISNLVTLCRFHHRLVHEGGFTVVRGTGGLLEFRTPYGECLTRSPRRARGDHAEVARRNRRRGVEVGPATCRPLDGRPFDLGMAVDGMLAAAPVPSSGVAARAP